ncbi:MAG TPA: hypothetical protein VG778_03175, partial [Blastocatellia bacterium]|nr:hypothetical protein [Blastocatellia bacterium]
MKLPNAENAVVEREKITDYLLNPAHRYGASKARFFGAFGFCADEWWRLAEALLELALDNDVAKVQETGFGPRYEVEGTLSVPDGRRPRVRTVWQLDHGAVAPRLITAYPTGE